MLRLSVSIFKRLNSCFQVLNEDSHDLCEGLSYSTFKMLHTFEHYFHISPQEKSRGLMSGDRGGQAAGPPLPIQRSRNLSLRDTVQLKNNISSPNS